MHDPKRFGQMLLSCVSSLYLSFWENYTAKNKTEIKYTLTWCFRLRPSGTVDNIKLFTPICCCREKLWIRTFHQVSVPLQWKCLFTVKILSTIDWICYHCCLICATNGVDVNYNAKQTVINFVRFKKQLNRITLYVIQWYADHGK